MQNEIEQMAKAICRVRGSCNDVCNPIEDCRAFKYAERAYEAGYRKIYDDHQRQCTCYALGCQMAEELKRKVAREIFEEIDEELGGLMNTYHKSQRFSDADVIRYARCLIAELKKKYMEEGK